MITRFSEVILTRKNGKQRIRTFKTERPLTEDLYISICQRLKITMPEWNALHNEFEFDDSHWYGNESMAPESIEFLDSQGFPIEGFEREE